MPAATDDAATALVMMRGWDWEIYHPDGLNVQPGLELSDIVTRLAIEGIRRPEAIILQLLCAGELLARGRYQWRKYQDYNHYQHESWLEALRPRHWQRLAAAIQTAQKDNSDSFGQIKLNLIELGQKDCPLYEWEPSANRFSYALLENAAFPWDEDYMEETFSAWDIEAWPKSLDAPDTLEFTDDTAANDAGEAKQSRGRSAAKWWPDFAEELALTVYEEGIPEGVGHEGQSELLDKILVRLSAAGKLEPSRSTVQPVINAVLARIRSAGK